jgi:hypothetical protein
MGILRNSAKSKKKEKERLWLAVLVGGGTRSGKAFGCPGASMPLVSGP